MKIFLDIGAHKGQTTKIAMEHKYKFDKIYSFEPFPECAAEIEKLSDSRVTVCNFGFWDKNCTKQLYSPGSKGASLFKDKMGENVESEKIELKKISEWFANNINKEDKVYLKINCEGSEVVILNDLVESGEYKKVDVLMVDFDVRKIPSQKHLMPRMKEKLRNLDIPIPKMFFIDEYKLGSGTHSYFTHYWLDNS